MHAGETVEERLWQALATAALLHRVLSRKHPKRGRASKRLAELGHENLRAVIQCRVQTLEHGLRREVELIEKNPVAVLERREEGAVGPSELARRAAIRGQVGSEEVHHVRLLAEVDADQVMARSLRQRGYQAGLTHARRTLEEDRLRELHRSKNPRGVAAGGRGGELKAHRLGRRRRAAGDGERGDAEDAVAVDERAIAGGCGEVVTSGVSGSLDRRVRLSRGN